MEISGSDRGISNLTEICAMPRRKRVMAAKACASHRVEPSAAMVSAAKMDMAETVATAMASSMSATAMTSAMSAAVASPMSAAAPLGYRAA